MSENSSSLLQALSQPEYLSRRRFVLSVDATTLLAGLVFKPNILSAAVLKAQTGQKIFTGKAFNLSIGEQKVFQQPGLNVPSGVKCG